MIDPAMTDYAAMQAAAAEKAAHEIGGLLRRCRDEQCRTNKMCMASPFPCSAGSPAPKPFAAADEAWDGSRFDDEAF